MPMAHLKPGLVSAENDNTPLPHPSVERGELARTGTYSPVHVEYTFAPYAACSRSGSACYSITMRTWP